MDTIPNMKISLKQAYDLINKASALIWDDIEFISYPPSTSELTGENENEFLYLSATDEEGYEYSATFTEGENREVTVKDNALILIDHEGEECRIVLLSVMDLSALHTTCKKCGSPLVNDRCADETCPYSDHAQSVELDSLHESKWAQSKIAEQTKD